LPERAYNVRKDDRMQCPVFRLKSAETYIL
jgi:hypothetical protein